MDQKNTKDNYIHPQTDRRRENYYRKENKENEYLRVACNEQLRNSARQTINPAAKPDSENCAAEYHNTEQINCEATKLVGDVATNCNNNIAEGSFNCSMPQEQIPVDNNLSYPECDYPKKNTSKKLHEPAQHVSTAPDYRCKCTENDKHTIAPDLDIPSKLEMHNKSIVYPKGHPCYLPQPEDCDPPKTKTAQDSCDEKMKPIGPWATGRVDWGPLGKLTGTRPVVDRYSVTRYSEWEWKQRNDELMKGISQCINNSAVVKFNSNLCMERTANKIDKGQENSASLLEQRSRLVNKWKSELERAANAMAEEVNILEAARQRLKTSMGVLRMPESIAGECLERRTARLELDLVRDEVEEELIKEVALVHEVRDLMNRLLKQFEEQLRVNKSVKQRFEIDWSDKKESYEIDTKQIGLKNSSPDIMFKPAATRFSDAQSTPDTWEHATKEILGYVEGERENSKNLRKLMESMFADIIRDLRMQGSRVDRALACVIWQTEEAKQKLERELLRTLQSIADTEKIISELKSSIRAKDMAMKIAQTRLDNRLKRPRAENCRDFAQFGLIDEVKLIAEGISALRAQLKQSEDSLSELIKTRADLEAAITVKKKTLSIDRDRCQEIRSHYPSDAALTGYH